MAGSAASDRPATGKIDIDEVDLSGKLAWIRPDQAKARKAIAMPLNDTASVSSVVDFVEA